MFRFHSIEKYHSDLFNSQTSCKEAVEYFLSAIKQNLQLNAFLEVFEQEALLRAQQLDALPTASRGKLHGVVIGIKDNICYKGHVSSAGSKILNNYTAPYSATAVEKLLAEGAIIIGRQNCDEFGMGSTNENSAYNPVLNPVDNSLVPGGSSGGSAAAVKAGLCMASLGSDTGGSVRLPADFCGVVGFKPTYGKVSRHGLIAYASSFDVIGILGNSASDVEKIAEVISGADDFDSTSSQQPFSHTTYKEDKEQSLRIAYFPEWIEHPSIDAEIASNIKNKIDKLKADGHEVLPVSFPLTDYIVPTYYILTTAEASSNLSRYDGVRYGYRNNATHQDLANFYKKNRSDAFGKEVKRRIMLGTFVLSTGYYDAYFTKAQQVRKLLKEQTDLIFKDFHFILAPNSPTPAFKFGEKSQDPVAMYMADIFTVFANLVGIPAIALPLFKHSANVPFGIQMLSSPHNEVSLLRFSHQLMQQ